MPDILNTSLTGMLAFQRAMQVTSHNISNANTPGYTRQVTEFSSRVGASEGGLYLGSGTQVSNVRRIFDAMQVGQLRSSTTGFARLDVLNTLANRVDVLLADADSGLNSSLQSYFSALQDVSNDPASISTRQALLGEADSVASRFTSLDDRLTELENEVNGRLRIAVDDINRIATSIAEINQRIGAVDKSVSQPNDLLDQRDQLILQLSEKVAVSTNIQDDGTMSVFIGAGQTLITGGTARQFTVEGSEFDATRLNVVYEGATGSSTLDTSAAGGELGGLLEYRTRILDPARRSLGQTAIAFATSMNSQHAAGMDLRGELGANLFTLAPPAVLASKDNTGSAAATASIADLGALSGADYVLEFDGSGYSVSRVDTGEVVSLTGSGSAVDPFVADGISIVVSGVPAAGDRLLIRTGTGAAGSLQNAISDPQALAMAAPTRAEASQDNLGSATISAAVVADIDDPNLLDTAIIEFTGPGTYSVNGAGSFAYTDGEAITVNGSSVTISGTPSAGDQFTVQANFGASGDNGNGLLLSDVQSKGLLDGGTVSINDNYARLVAAVGGTASQIRGNLEAQGVVLANAENTVAATSGVNLDEEAANLIKFQQAYQAVAQIVAVVGTMFDSLLDATRR